MISKDLSTTTGTVNFHNKAMKVCVAEYFITVTVCSSCSHEIDPLDVKFRLFHPIDG